MRAEDVRPGFFFPHSPAGSLSLSPPPGRPGLTPILWMNILGLWEESNLASGSSLTEPPGLQPTDPDLLTARKGVCREGGQNACWRWQNGPGSSQSSHTYAGMCVHVHMCVFVCMCVHACEWGGGPVSFMSPSPAWSPLSPSPSKSSPPLYPSGAPPHPTPPQHICKVP